MKRLRKEIIFLIVLVVCLSFVHAGCGGGKKSTGENIEEKIESEIPEGLKKIKGKAGAEARQANLMAINAAIHSYFLENGQYPTSIEQLVPRYLQTIPADPEGGVYYIKFEGGRAEAAVR